MTGTFARFWKLSSWLALSLAAASCQRSAEPVEATPIPAEPRTWLLSDGTRGFRLGDYGLGYPNLPSYSATMYERSGEEKLVRQPHPLNFRMKWLSPEGKQILVTSLSQSQELVGSEVRTVGRASAGSLSWNFTAVTTIKRMGGPIEFSIRSDNPQVRPETPAYVEPGAFTVRSRVISARLTVESSDSEDSRFVALASHRLQWDLPVTPAGFPPMGLSHDLYFGHTFWDADVWMMPVLGFIAPETAMALSSYRVNRFAQAKKNFGEWQAEGCPIGKGTLQRDGVRLREPAAMYPWESSVTGRETVPGPSKFQHHITGSVVFGLQRAADFGLVNPESLAKVGRAAAAFYQFRADEVRPGLKGVRGTMSPDEFFTGDNDLYTNILAEQVVRKYADPTWQAYRPRDNTTFLTYDGDRLKLYKQAAALLAVYPLQDPAAEKEATAMLARFAGRVIKSGPAMSHAIDSTIRARFGDVQQAYREWRDSWVPFTTNGDMFREKASLTQDRSYFYTGAAGALQTVIYGFGGARIDERPTGQPGEIRLPSGRYLSFKPRLPNEWKSISLTDVRIGDKRYDFLLTNGGAKINSR